MQPNLEDLSKKILHTQLSAIPERYRSPFISLIKQTQKDLKDKTYQIKDNEGLLTLVIKNDGEIKDLIIHENLYKKYSTHEELNSDIKKSLIYTHKKALDIAKQDMISELTRLENKVNILLQNIIEKIKNE